MASFSYQSSHVKKNSSTFERDSFLKQHWFEFLILLGLFYLLLCRDVHLIIGYHAPANAGQVSQTDTPANLSSFGLLTGHPHLESQSDITQLFHSSALPAELEPIDLARLTRCQAFIERFAKVAISEQEKFGIPASVTLAQALISSRAGEHPMAIQGNNFFGTICSQGTECLELDGLDLSKYHTPWESFRAHSLLLRNEAYQDLFRFRATDYKGWAQGLLNAGYYSSQTEADKLVQIIESLDLFLFDVPVS
ncbi:MAG: glucosaminidase domain-containing protein [Saprospiraceae bacterium]|nr:glucosaminidase domain-containing protein [Saprospiraceae bacterium]